LGKLALAAYANANEDDRLRHLLKYSWKKVAEKDSLLSAQGMLMLTDEPVEDLTVKETKEKMTNVDDAKEKNSAEEKEGEVENLPVVAQVEILYNVEQTLDVITTKQDDDKNKVESEEKMTVT
jgi:hypothetical protein